MIKMTETSERKDLLELMVLENPIHGCLAPSTRSENHGSRFLDEQEAKKLGVGDQIKTFKGLPPVAYFLWLGSTS